MSDHTAEIFWRRDDGDFLHHHYSRAHRWQFDGGLTVPASSSPHVVRLPFSEPSAVDPEEAFVASLSSCHMLWFLDLAARAGYLVESYLDQAIGTMERTATGKMAITTVCLHPHVVFGGSVVPTDTAVSGLHHAAHENCYLANSVHTAINTQGSWSHQLVE